MMHEIPVECSSSPLGRPENGAHVEHAVVVRATRQQFGVALPSLIHIPSKDNLRSASTTTHKTSRRMGMIFDPETVASHFHAEDAEKLRRKPAFRPTHRRLGGASTDEPPPYQSLSVPPPYSITP